MGFRMIAPKRVRKAKTAGSREVLRRLGEYLDSVAVTGEPVEILCDFWKDQQNVITYQELRQAVKDGEIDQGILRQWSEDYSYLVKTALGGMWAGAMKAGAASQPLLEAVADGFTFRMQTPGIFSWIEQKGAEFVTACTKTQKDAIAALLTKKMRDGHTVDELSQLIRPCIGLTEGDAKAAARLYDSIVANLRKEHPRMKPESIRRKALDATQKYAERKHRQRAMTIAQTESAFAYNRGADEGIRQAQSEGYLGDMKKRWSTSGDDAVCGLCASLEGMEVDIDSDFSIRGRLLFPGQHMLPPAHPRCACAVEYIEAGPSRLAAGNLSASDNDSGKFPEHDAPQYIGSLADLSEDMVQSTLKGFETELARADIENAVVISKSGLVWKCFGNKNAVYPNVDLGEELREAYVIHNHPMPETHFSFSYDDISLFMGYQLSQLTGVDGKYVYTVRWTPETVYAGMEELEHAYKGENYVAFLEQVLYGNADPYLDEYDFYVRRLAVQYGFQYERKKR